MSASTTIYLDNAATTAVAPEVIQEMLPYLETTWGNPSSLYAFGQQAHTALSDARSRIAAHIGARAQDVYFTSGGTESNNWAIKETMFAYRAKGRHFITSEIEHHATSQSAAWLEKHGYEVTYLPVDEEGLIDPEDFRKAIRPDTTLASFIYGNNEVGTIEPIGELAAIAHEHNVLIHTDAVQVVGHLPVDVEALDVDFLSASGHKFNAPKGVGFLFIRKGVKTRSLLSGGAQERKRRAGTENVPSIMGMAKALDLCAEHMRERIKHEQELRDHLINRVLNEIEHCRLNGHGTLRLPSNTNFSFESVESEALVLMLEQRGVLASSGSACAAGAPEPSQILLAMGLSQEMAYGSLRLTVGHGTTLKDIDYAVDTLKEVIGTLRA